MQVAKEKLNKAARVIFGGGEGPSKPPSEVLDIEVASKVTRTYGEDMLASSSTTQVRQDLQDIITEHDTDEEIETDKPDETDKSDKKKKQKKRK